MHLYIVLAFKYQIETYRDLPLLLVYLQMVILLQVIYLILSSFLIMYAHEYS